MNYKILKTNEKNIGISSKVWETANEIKIDKVEWKEYPYCPETTVRVLAGDDGIYVRFVTDEQEIIMDCKEVNGDVFKDSCVEFFFKPNPEENDGYFNFEINAAGTPHVGYGSGRSPLRTRLSGIDASIFRVETEFPEKGFILKFFIPYSLIEEKAGKIGEYFMGNFQKCKEKGNTPHFVTWNPIKTENPDFHRPEYFVRIDIEK
ncbi:MAG: hypothetical protein E7411_06230 [Ruminococcaceae bacterium]|nr:hypothetical protein [Oscillospiraceae bacterium]